MLKRIVSVLMLLVLLFSFVTLGLGVSLPEVKGTKAGSTSISSQWLAATSWNKTYGGNNTDLASSVVQTSDGGYILTGTTWSYGAGNGDAWLVKVGANGTMQWSKTYGGTYNERAYSVVQTLDGGYAVAGYTDSYGAGSSDFWLVKTYANGTMQWSETYGGTGSDYALSMVQTADGGYALAGCTSSYGAGSFDFWLVKTAANGTMQWNKTYGGTGDDQAFSMVQTADGGYALGGYTNSYGAGDYDFWLVKVAVNGTMQWSKAYGGTALDYPQSVVQTSDGGYAVAGTTYSYGAGGYDSWLVKTYSNGTVQWSKTYGGTNNDYGDSVVQTNDGGYAVAGATMSYGGGINDFWLVKTAPDGTMQWSETYGGTGSDYATSLVQTSDGGYAVAGRTASYGSGSDDFWLVKLTPRTVYIHADGSVDPSSAPIVRNGSLYTLIDNITSLADGIVIQKDSVTLDGARYTVQGSGGGCGIVLGSHVTVRNVNVRSFYYGTVGNGTSCSVLSQSNLTDNFYGVWLYSVNSTVSQNTISGNTYGVGTYLSSSGNNISDNVITNNWQGIYLRDTSLTVISRNKFTDNDNGAIGLRESNDNTVTRNNMENNLAGIWLWKSGSTHNVISENNITGNTQCGVQLSEYASNNAFYHNNFENNTVQVSFADNTTINIWDNGYPSGGNYWSTYLNRTDLCRGIFQNITGSDAIADTGYSLDVNNRDNYPLMGLFGSPTATGTNITVFPTPDVGLTFKNVTTAGSTTVNETATGPPLPLAFNLVGQYFDIETTAAYTGKITLRFIYNDTGMSQLIEENLRLGHWNETSDSWEDITTLVDTENNVIYGATDSLSIFGIRSLDNNADPSLSFVSAACSKTVVGQGFSVNINVTVSNIDVTPKTVDINLFADADLIGRQQVTDLDPGEQRTINFIWQVPSDYNKGNYTLIVGDLAGWIIVAIVGDVVGIGTFPNALPDGKVDIKDLAAMAKCYGANYPNPQYVANYDLTGSTPGLADGKIDIKDLATAAKNYGKIDP